MLLQEGVSRQKETRGFAVRLQESLLRREDCHDASRKHVSRERRSSLGKGESGDSVRVEPHLGHQDESHSGGSKKGREF